MYNIAQLFPNACAYKQTWCAKNGYVSYGYQKQF